MLSVKSNVQQRSIFIVEGVVIERSTARETKGLTFTQCMKIIWESDDWPGCIFDSSITCLNWISIDNNGDTGLLATGKLFQSIYLLKYGLTRFNYHYLV